MSSESQAAPQLPPLLRRLGDPPGAHEVRPPAAGSGPAGNARLTALTGIALLIPLVIVLGSGALFGSMRTVHFFAGFVVLPLAALKLASTGWRVARYYLADRRDRAYRSAGPPWWVPRLLGAPLVAATVLVLLSGMLLWTARTERGVWSTIHTTSAVVFAILIGLHLALRGWRTVWEGGAETGRIRGPVLPGRRRRQLAVAATVAGAVVLASVLTASTVWPAQPARHHEFRVPQG